MIRTFTALTALLLSTAAFAEDAPKTAAPAEAAAPAATTAPAVTTAATTDTASLKAFTYTPKDTDLVYGKESAPVTIVEYASLSCSHCKAFYMEVFPQLEKNYIDTGKLKFVYRNYPLNQPAFDAAQMVQCADTSAKPAYIKVLFTTQDKWAYDSSYKESLAGIAALGGMERKKFDDCLANKDIQNSILLTYQEARDSFKVSATPTLFLDGELVKGSHNYESISKAIDDAIAAAPKK